MLSSVRARCIRSRIRERGSEMVGKKKERKEEKKNVGVNEERTSNLRTSIAENLFPFIRFAYVSTLCPTILHSRSINFQWHQRKKRRLLLFWESGRDGCIHWPASIVCAYVCAFACVSHWHFLHTRELASSKVKRAKKSLAILGNREEGRGREKEREREEPSRDVSFCWEERKKERRTGSTVSTRCACHISKTRYYARRIRTQRWKKQRNENFSARYPWIFIIPRRMTSLVRSLIFLFFFFSSPSFFRVYGREARF